MSDETSCRTLSLIVSILIFTYHAATAYLCTYLPSDPLYVTLGVTGYAWYGCTLSVIGILGSIKVYISISVRIAEKQADIPEAITNIPHNLLKPPFDRHGPLACS